MSANPHRGEVPVVLGGRERVLRPTFQALAEIESKTGKTLQQLIALGMGAALGLSDTTAIITAGLRGAGESVLEPAVGPEIVEAGLQSMIAPAAKFVLFGLTGGRDPEPKDDDPGEANSGTGMQATRSAAGES
jgi:hypothetical protein